MSRIDVVNGNLACAIGVKLSRPDVVAAYPITPQSSVVENLTQFRANGEIDAEMAEVESEHSAMSLLTGVSMAGGRTFTATSSQGLALMYEPYFRASTLRLPIVMAIVNREMISPQTVWGAPQDSLTVRDAGWIQIYVEDNQEIIDSIIQAYRIGEDRRIALPVNVCYDGFYLSHMTERVVVPDQELVDEFLPPWSPERVYVDLDAPLSTDPLTPGDLLTIYRQKHMAAQRQALEVIEEVGREFAARFGRDWHGLIEEYRLDDADYVVVTLGSMTGAAREAVDLRRERGTKVGLMKIRTLRPFPFERVGKILAGRKAIAVVDRNVSFGWSTGIIFQEVMAAQALTGRIVPTFPYIGGLGGMDLRQDLFMTVIDRLVSGEQLPDTIRDATRWLL